MREAMRHGLLIALAPGLALELGACWGMLIVTLGRGFEDRCAAALPNVLAQQLRHGRGIDGEF